MYLYEMIILLVLEHIITNMYYLILYEVLRHVRHHMTDEWD
jgi:hypothetical protein